jgi:hypothetical protein
MVNTSTVMNQPRRMRLLRSVFIRKKSLTGAEREDWKRGKITAAQESGWGVLRRWGWSATGNPKKSRLFDQTSVSFFLRSKG